MEIQETPLFNGISGSEMSGLVNCLKPVVNSYPKNALVYSEDEEITRLGVILSGSVKVIEEDFAGNTNIITDLAAPDLLGEEFVFSGGKSTMTVRAAEPADIAFIDNNKLTGVCGSACAQHIRLVRNLVQMLAGKSAEQREKLYILQKRTTREKLLAYLSAEAKKAGSGKFRVPLNRAQMAQYLCVDRSAMSRELCAMRDSGILEFYKNSFILNET